MWEIKQKVDRLRYLGVQMDNHLKRTDHINEGSSLKMKSTKTVYDTGHSVWGEADEYSMLTLTIIQKHPI